MRSDDRSTGRRPRIVLDSALLVGLGLLLSGALSREIRANRRRRLAWQRSAVRLGISDIEIGGLWKPTLRGRHEDLQIVARTLMDSDNQLKTRIVIEAPNLLPERLGLRAERTPSPPTRLFQPKSREERGGGPDIEIGDQSFDDVVLVQGHPVLALALLDCNARRLLCELVRAGCRIEAGTVQLVRLGSLDEAGFTRIVGNLIKATRALATPTNPAELLARNALEDPLAMVRRRNLEVLIERFGHHAATPEVLRKALNDASGRVRVKAAAALGDEGAEVLDALLSDPKCNPMVVAEALIGLGPRLSLERTIALLDDSLRRRRSEVALAAIAALGKCGGSAALARLVTILKAGDPQLAVASIRAVGEIGDAESVRVLLSTLDDAQGAVQLVALEAIARVATVDAVPRLRAFIEARSSRSDLARAAVSAIAAIQERVTGAARGQLSLAAGGPGELSLVEDTQGQLSLAEESE